MKIVHLTTVHPKNDNRIFYKECMSLHKAGFDISLIVAGVENEEFNNINIIGFPKEKSRLKRILRTSLFDLLCVCKKVDADIYHFHDPEILFAALILKLRGKKVIYDIHENNPAAILSKPYIKLKLFQKIISKTFDIIEKVSVNFFDAIITARPDISARFKHKKLITLRNFPILPDFSKLNDIDISKKKPAVIFVGGMTTIRGISELIDAFVFIPEIELWLLGPIKEKYLEEKVEKVENIRYFGTVEAYEVFSYIHKADIGIITFLPFPNHLETLATKPFEYMSCGKPMIMSNFEYWKETFKESSLYVDPSKPKEIAISIKNLLEDKSLLEEMAKKNKQLSLDEYNWEKESLKLLRLYGELSK